MRFPMASWLFAVLVNVSACTGGSPSDQSGQDGRGPDGMGGGPDDPVPNERLCTAVLSTSGDFQPDATVEPNPAAGCWPFGTWTFQTAITSNNCDPAPAVREYKFKVSKKLNQDGDILWEYTYLTDPSARSLVKVIEGGAGLCEGKVELFSADGKAVFLLEPVLKADNTLTGGGEYSTYATDQWPFNPS